MKSRLFYKRYPNVKIGKNPIVSDYVILGQPPKGKKSGKVMLRIGNHAVLRSFTVIYAGSKIGNHFSTGHYSVVRENNLIGNNVVLGITSELAPGNKIGNRVTIHSGCFLEFVTVGDDVFIGPNTVFLDDPHPPCPKYADCIKGAIVEDYVSIGGNVTILPGVSIGHHSLIGAGSVITKNIPSNSVVTGNPARVIKGTSGLKCYPGFFKKPYIWRTK